MVRYIHSECFKHFSHLASYCHCCVTYLSTRAKPQLVVLDDVKIFDSVFISSELTTLPDKLIFIWTSTRDTSVRKLNYPCKLRSYGLEFNIKQKSLHLVLCILLAGDIATNPGPTTIANAQFGNLPRSHIYTSSCD
jgi:hypothetical protein